MGVVLTVICKEQTKQKNLPGAKIEKCSRQSTVNLAICEGFYNFKAMLADLFSLVVPNMFKI